MNKIPHKIADNYSYHPKKTSMLGILFAGACVVSIFAGGYFIFDATTKVGLSNLNFIKDTLGQTGEGLTGGALTGLGCIGLIGEGWLIHNVKKELRKSYSSSLVED